MIKSTSAGETVWFAVHMKPVITRYRGNAVGQVVLAGDAQQFVLWQLNATEGTRTRLLLQLRRVRTSVVSEEEVGKSWIDEMKHFSFICYTCVQIVL